MLPSSIVVATCVGCNVVRFQSRQRLKRKLPAASHVGASIPRGAIPPNCQRLATRTACASRIIRSAVPADSANSACLVPRLLRPASSWPCCLRAATRCTASLLKLRANSRRCPTSMPVPLSSFATRSQCYCQASAVRLVLSPLSRAICSFVALDRHTISLAPQHRHATDALCWGDFNSRKQLGIVPVQHLTTLGVGRG